MRGRLRDLTPRRLAAVLALVLVAAGALAGGLAVGGDGEEAKGPIPEAGSQPGVERRTSFLARLIPPPAERPEPSAAPGVPRSVSELVERLPADRKVAQLFLLGFQGQDLNAAIFRQLRRLDLGGIVIGAENYGDPQQLASLAGEARVIAEQERHVPPWVMAAQEGGDFNVFDDLPPRTAASDLPDVEQAAAEAREAGATLRPLGVTGLLGPVIDVGLADDPAIGPRAFSDDPEPVAAFAAAVVEAYRAERVFAAVKHFPGLGSASQSTEEGPAAVGLSLEELAARDLVPFRAAFDAGAAAVLVGHGLYTTDDFVTPGSLSEAITTELLRDELGFRGVAITDDLADPSITALGSVPDSAVRAVRAGADMLYVSGPAGDQQAAYVAVLRAARSGEIPVEQLDSAVVRILSAKRDYGLIR